MGRTFRILAIDGGGVRGVIPATFLMEIEQRTGQPVHRLFDLIAGTSTGGILGLGLAAPGDDGQSRYQAADGIRLYREFGPRIFARSRPYTLRTIDGLLGPKYPEHPLLDVMQDQFGAVRLKDTLTDVIITSYDIERRAPWFFRTLRARARPDYDFSLVEVARATTAAPSNFTPTRLRAADGEVYTLVDGGVFANNPAMVAYVDALSLYADRGYEQVVVVSMGTGVVPGSIAYSAARRWGLLGWSLPAIDILKTGANESVDYQMRQMLNRMAQQAEAGDSADYYHRLQVQLQPGTNSMDDPRPENIDRLQAAAQDFVRANPRLFARIAAQLTE